MPSALGTEKEREMLENDVRVGMRQKYPTLLESMTDHQNRVAGVYVAGMVGFSVGIAAMIAGGCFGIASLGVGQVRSTAENVAASWASAKTGTPTASTPILPPASSPSASTVPPPPFASPPIPMELPPPTATSAATALPPSPIPPLPSLGLPSAPSAAGSSSPRVGTLSLPATSEGKEGVGSAVVSSPLVVPMRGLGAGGAG